jgi:uncharacterized membrane protein YfcA
MDLRFAVWLFTAALGTSALGGALGMASGIFIVPLLVTLGGIDFHTAVGVSLVSVIACSCGSAAAFLRIGITNVRLALVLEIATTLGALTGVFLSGIVSVSALSVLFAAILFVSAWQMTKRRVENADSEPSPPDSWATRLMLHSAYPDGGAGRDVVYHVDRLPLGMALMYGAGLISALLGIGSGVLKIPAMDTALRLPIKVSSATSNFMIGVTAAAGGLAYFARGEIDPAIAGPVALGSVAGAAIGARLLVRIPANALRLFFIVVLLVLGFAMLLSASGAPFGGGLT